MIYCMWEFSFDPTISHINTASAVFEQPICRHRKPVYFSYAACGMDDEYTKGNDEACVNQKVLGSQLSMFSLTPKPISSKRYVCGSTQIQSNREGVVLQL